MANSEEKSQIRPTLPLRLNNSTSLNSGCGMSPVTDLMFNLSGLSTNSSIVETPKKRISWSNLTPNCSLSSKDSDQSFAESPQTDTLVSPNRLLKNVNPQNESTQIIRRVRTFPFHPNPLRDKENIPNCILTDHISRKLKCLGSSTSDSNNSIELHDSGYSTGQTDLEESNSVTDKNNLLLQRLNYENESKSANEIKDCLNMPSPSSTQSTIVRSTLFINEDGDDFLDVFGIDKQNENLDFPVNITNLLTKPVIHSLSEDTIFGDNSVKQKNEEKKIRPGIRRCLSLISECDLKIKKSEFDSLVQRKKHCSSYDNINDPQNSQINNKSTDSNNNNNGCAVNEMKPAFKRPDPPKDFFCPIQNKRRKSVPLVPLLTNDSRLLSSKKSPLQRCHSETEATIMKALQRSVQEPDLIGDFSKPFALPLVKGKHQDVKTISAATVMDLLKGKYKHIVDSFTVVDCRYPYEFEGGHIRDAKNIFTKEGIVEYFLSNKNKFSQDKRNVVIFHCEFSSERGPTLYRFLRNMDRETNKDRYPLLHHPELYVLHGGYKAFYENFKEYCEPQEYKPMLHKEHEQELRQFKAKSKSWNGDCKARMGIRPGLKF